MGFKVTFWGVRGSVPVPDADYLKYGGNTTCVEVEAGDQHIIIDSGTGIRGLGAAMIKKQVSQSTLLVSHTHWDHINGFPFFSKNFDPNFQLNIIAGHLTETCGIQNALSSQMMMPYFPIPIEMLMSTINYQDILQTEQFLIGDDVRVTACSLNHPNGCTGYRIDYKGKSVCFISDTEHYEGRIDEGIAKLIDGSDMIIYDSAYTEKEYPGRKGWGHSTPMEGIKLCLEAKVKRLITFHHDPSHNDEFIDNIMLEYRQEFDNIQAAYEGMCIELL